MEVGCVLRLTEQHELQVHSLHRVCVSGGASPRQAVLFPFRPLSWMGPSLAVTYVQQAFPSALSGWVA